MTLAKRIRIEEKRGLGWAVLCGMLIFPALVGLVIVVVRMFRLRLRNVPSVRLFGRIPFGSVLVWGTLILVIGLMLCMGYLAGDHHAADEKAVFWLVCVPEAVTGALLMIYWGLYINYRRALEVVLRLIAEDEIFPSAPLLIEVPGMTYGDKQVNAMLNDLQENGTIVCELSEDEIFRAWIVDENLLAVLDAPVRPEAPHALETEWTCPNCGAPNHRPRRMGCEYCGSTSGE